MVAIPPFIWTPWGPWLLSFSDIELILRTPLPNNLIRNKDDLTWMKKSLGGFRACLYKHIPFLAGDLAWGEACLRKAQKAVALKHLAAYLKSFLWMPARALPKGLNHIASWESDKPTHTYSLSCLDSPNQTYSSSHSHLQLYVFCLFCFLLPTYSHMPNQE